MTAPAPYLHFAGNARDALAFYQGVFGGELTVHTKGDLGFAEGEPDDVAHGILDGPVSLFASDSNETFSSSGLMFSLLGTADPDTLRGWFAALALDGTIVDDLQERPWGASDGQVRDRFGLLWLIGFEPS